jgi:hypothetical protein
LKSNNGCPNFRKAVEHSGIFQAHQAESEIQIIRRKFRQCGADSTMKGHECQAVANFSENEAKIKWHLYNLVRFIRLKLLF